MILVFFPVKYLNILKTRYFEKQNYFLLSEKKKVLSKFKIKQEQIGEEK